MPDAVLRGPGRVAVPHRQGPKDPPRICAGCGQLRRHCGLGLCVRCWQKNPQRALVAAAGLAARLDDPPAWLADFELPLASLCVWLSHHTQQLAERRIVLLRRSPKKAAQGP